MRTGRSWNLNCWIKWAEILKHRAVHALMKVILWGDGSSPVIWSSLWINKHQEGPPRCTTLFQPMSSSVSTPLSLMGISRRGSVTECGLHTEGDKSSYVWMHYPSPKVLICFNLNDQTPQWCSPSALTHNFSPHWRSSPIRFAEGAALPLPSVELRLSWVLMTSPPTRSVNVCTW